MSSGPGVDLVANDPSKAGAACLDSSYRAGDGPERGIAAPRSRPLRIAGGRRPRPAVRDDHTIATSTSSPSPPTRPGRPRRPRPGPGRRPVRAGYGHARRVPDRCRRQDGHGDLAGRARRRPARRKPPRPDLAGRRAGPPRSSTSRTPLWRWRPADATGTGTPGAMRVIGSAVWGNDIRAIGTFVRELRRRALQLLHRRPVRGEDPGLSPAADGSRLPAGATERLPTDRPGRRHHLPLIDGDIYVAENGQVSCVIPASGWQVTPPADTPCRPASRYVWRPSPTKADRLVEPRDGTLYAYDPSTSGSSPSTRRTGIRRAVPSRRQRESWTDLRGMVVVPGPDADRPGTIVWISATGSRAPCSRRRPMGPRRRRAPRVCRPAHRRGRRRPRPGRRPPRLPSRDGGRHAVIPLRDANPTRRRRSSRWPSSSPASLVFAWSSPSRPGGEGGPWRASSRITAPCPAGWPRPSAGVTWLGGPCSVSSPACSSTPAGCTSSATCSTCGSSATTSRIAWAALAFLAFYLFGGSRPRSPDRSSTRRSNVPLVGASGSIAADAGRLPRPLPAGPHPAARVPRLLLPADRCAGRHRPRVLVPAPARRRGRVAGRGDGPTAGSRSSRTSAASWSAASWPSSYRWRRPAAAAATPARRAARTAMASRRPACGRSVG